MRENEVVRSFYDENVEVEWARLERHPIEYAIVKRYLERYIHPGERVLDVGGGPGRYSLMLAERGCDVTLVDLSPNNAAFARERAKERGVPLNALSGDALEIGSLVAGPFDHVLLMGPLYHLMSEEAHVRAVRGCRDLLREDGLIFASIITLQAGVLYFLEYGPELILADGEDVYLEAIERGESYTGKAFTDAHFMRWPSLKPFMRARGFDEMHTINCEGMCGPREGDIVAAEKAVYDRWLELSLNICEREEYMGLAQHVLYIGRKTKDG